jgi:cytochrome c peroxidase
MKNRPVSAMFALSIVAMAGVQLGHNRRGVSVDPSQLKAFAPLPAAIASQTNPITAAKVNLGRMLYYERRLSRNQKISCNTCHDLEKYGVDGQRVSDGFKGQKGTRNAPTVYNAAGHFVQFWDGRARDVEEQATGPIMNPVEMAMPSQRQVLAVLKSMPGYVDAFRKAFPGQDDPVTIQNMALAIGAFERGLVTPSRWDRFLEGDQNALTDAEKAGFNTFIQAGCQTCHSGAYLGGQTYCKLGAARPYPDISDVGRQQVTRQQDDRMVFKVPSLRNVEKTSPYFHNGKVENLSEAVKEMGEYQLGRDLRKDEVGSILVFLRALTGEIPAEYIKPPVLPRSTAKTPEPSVT